MFVDHILQDEYWDCADKAFPLTTRDIWLRLRDSKWEIKFPPALLHSAGISLSQKPCFIDQYAELDTPADISKFLHKHAFLSGSHASSTALSLELRADGFFPFASITTHRTTLTYKDATVVLDETDDGYCVGEVEVMLTDATSGDAAHHAEQYIKSIAAELGITLDGGMPGKVLVYIRQHNAQHYAALEHSGLLASKRIRMVAASKL